MRDGDRPEVYGYSQRRLSCAVARHVRPLAHAGGEAMVNKDSAIGAEIRVVISSTKHSCRKVAAIDVLSHG